MPDKNRNMNDINDQKTIDRTEQAALDQTAEQQSFSEEIRRRLAEPDSGKPTLEEFKVLVYKDREKRRKKRNALVACIVAAFIVGYLTYDDLVPEVGADKNPKETIKTEDVVIIEDGGYGSSIGEENVWMTEDWEQVKDARTIVEELPIPKHVPEMYAFKRLEIEKIVEDDFLCKYYYIDTNTNSHLKIEILITKGESTSMATDICKKIRLDDKVEIVFHNEEKATVFMDGGITVTIWGKLLDSDIIKIVEGLDC